MDVTLLYFDDCPNWRQAAEHLDILAAENADLTMSRQLVETDEEAQRVGFRGLPSILLMEVEPHRVTRRLDPLGGLSHDRATTAGEVSRRAA